jgi:hypothetical protein
MYIRSTFALVLALSALFVSHSANGQKQVDMERALRENPELYTGSYTRLGVGFSRSSFKYSTVFDGVVINPLHFNIDFGKRINRKFGTYFTISGDIMLNEKQLGFDDINQWAQAGMSLGGIFYVLGGNSYFSPEVGLGILNFEYTQYQVTGSNDVYSMGIISMLKYGYDRNLTGRLYIGLQAYLSYAHTWETDAGETAEAPTASSFVYGAAINFRLGK